MSSSYNPPWETTRRNGEDVPIAQDHHIIPSSRGGWRVGNIIKRVPSDVHWCWHRLFGNLLPTEIITVVLMFFFRTGEFTAWKRFIPEGEGPPETFTPDQIILEMIRLIFPKTWIPETGLIRTLVERRLSKRVTPNQIMLEMMETFPDDWVPSYELMGKLEKRKRGI